MKKPRKPRAGRVFSIGTQSGSSADVWWELLTSEHFPKLKPGEQSAYERGKVEGLEEAAFMVDYLPQERDRIEALAAALKTKPAEGR